MAGVRAAALPESRGANVASQAMVEASGHYDADRYPLAQVTAGVVDPRDNGTRWLSPACPGCRAAISGYIVAGTALPERRRAHEFPFSPA